MVYNEIQAAYIHCRSRNNGLLLYLVSTKHCRFVCFQLSSHLCVFVHVSVCASVQLNWHSHGTMNKITDGRASKSTRKQQHLIIYINYYRYLNDRQIYACCAYIRHVGVVESISRLIHEIA